MLYESKKQEGKTTGFVSLLILIAITVAIVGFIATYGRAILELTYALVHYLNAATEAIKDGKMGHTNGHKGDALYSGSVHPGYKESLA